MNNIKNKNWPQYLKKNCICRVNNIQHGTIRELETSRCKYAQKRISANLFVAWEAQLQLQLQLSFTT